LAKGHIGKNSTFLVLGRPRQAQAVLLLQKKSVRKRKVTEKRIREKIGRHSTGVTRGKATFRYMVPGGELGGDRERTAKKAGEKGLHRGKSPMGKEKIQTCVNMREKRARRIKSPNRPCYGREVGRKTSPH